MDSKNGTWDEYIIFLILMNKSVFVKLTTKAALEDIGEHLSPK